MRRLIAHPRLRWVLAAAVAVAVLGPLGYQGWKAWKQGRVQAAVADAEAAVRAQVGDSASGAGFVLRQVTVEGREHTSAAELVAALGLPQGGPLMGLDLGAAQARLEALPWVKTAIVERHLPDMIHIRLKERTPIALWSHDARFSLVDADGRVIDGDISSYANLPQVVGAGAPEAASDLVAMLAARPDLNARVKAAVRVGERRWDLWFDDLRPDRGVVVRLPEAGIAEALSQLSDLEAKNRILERDIIAVDLRIDGRLTVRLTPRAAQAEADAQAAAKKAAKSGGSSSIPVHGTAQDT